MVEEIKLKTRVQLKYNTLEGWQSISVEGKGGNLVLLKGEVGICAVPRDSSHLQATPPAIMFKVGDGETAFKDLPWASALAADVYAWAKKDKIDIVANGTGNVVSSIKWENNQFVYETASVATSEGLQALQEAVEGLNSDLSGLTTRVETAEGEIDTLQASVTENTSAIAAVKATAEAALPQADFDSFKTENSTAIADAKKAGTDAADALNEYKAENDAKVSKNATDIANLEIAVKAGVTFKGKFDDKPATDDYSNGDLIIVGAKEYILYVNGEGNKEWLELGDEGTHLTKVTADGYYVAKNEDVVGGTKCKITYDSKGLVTGGSDLEASDIPELDASKITSGLIADERIASADTWNKKQDAITADNKLSVDLISGLAGIATSGSYNDLADTPDIPALITEEIGKLDVVVDGAAAGKTLASLTEVDGKIAATFQDIAINSAQITDLEAAFPGREKLGTVTSVAVGNGLKVTGDASVSPKIEIDDEVVFVLNCGSSTTVI